MTFSYDAYRRWLDGIETANASETLQQLDYLRDDAGRKATDRR